MTNMERLEEEIQRSPFAKNYKDNDEYNKVRLSKRMVRKCVNCDDEFGVLSGSYERLCKRCTDEVIENSYLPEGTLCLLCGKGNVKTRASGYEGWITECDNCGYLYDED